MASFFLIDTLGMVKLSLCINPRISKWDPYCQLTGDKSEIRYPILKENVSNHLSNNMKV